VKAGEPFAARLLDVDWEESDVAVWRFETSPEVEVQKGTYVIMAEQNYRRLMGWISDAVPAVSPLTDTPEEHQT
jgi:hypothetical protein